ncbi:T9SS type A sorting domain-containing protein [bacterium]|nr:T9SS type A sorting domain-containing protein [bacterium]MBU1651623.1 T9SS type A sorting domain-containing protein [bacterium]
MTSLNKISGGLLIAALSVLPLAGISWSYSGGPPDGAAGNPPQNINCTQCHSSFAVNSGNGSLQILNLPAEYEPGTEYTLTISLSDAGQSRWGFEMTALNVAGATGGSFIAPDANSQVSAGPPQYIKQTSAGTFQGQALAEWDITWTAPAAGTGAVDFYLAGNAADGNFSTSGDYIYTITAAVPEVLGVNDPVAATPLSSTLVSAYPNPFNPIVALHLNQLPAGEVNLEVININGQVLQSLRLNSLGSSDLKVPMDLSAIPSGHYFVRTVYPGGMTVTPIVKLK